jgi:hypothetical protein
MTHSLLISISNTLADYRPMWTLGRALLTRFKDLKRTFSTLSTFSILQSLYPRGSYNLHDNRRLHQLIN